MQHGHGVGLVESHMQVISGPRSHDGPMSGGVRQQQQQFAPTWREVLLNGLNGKRTSKWQVVEGGVVASGVPFLAPLDCDPCHNKHLIW